MAIYGYVRVSTLDQNKERQREAIKAAYPEKDYKVIFYEDECTGKKMDRPEWNRMYAKLKAGDVIVFDEVSRMSRDAEEGFNVYQELYGRGIEMVFLKEPHINTASYREALKGSINIDVKSGDQDTDELVCSIMNALNTFMMKKVQADIRRAFERSQAETDMRSKRQKGGMEERRRRNDELKEQYPDTYTEHPEYKQLGRNTGDKLHIKKAGPIQELIREYSRDFNGHNTDSEVLAILNTKTVKIPNKKRSGKVEMREIPASISRNTLYAYKKQMRGEV